MRNFYIVDIEPLDNRYTKQWQTWMPVIAERYLGPDYNVVNISGSTTGEYSAPQPGAFFDFVGTCSYKASQAIKISELFRDNLVSNGDIFFFTDAWNQTVHFVKYMSELKNIDVKMTGIWHAGAYDPTDILGVTVKNKSWVYDFERASYHALDLNFFGTNHNKNLFIKTLGIEDQELTLNKCRAHGVYPLEWIFDLQNNDPKENIVVFPHRLNYDKAPWVFDEIASLVNETRPDIKFVKTQELNLSKEDYYKFLRKCKVIFSANKHENLGIGTFEAMCSGCLPVLPKKLSYAEMYSDLFLYSVTEDLYNQGSDRQVLANMIINFIDNYDQYKEQWHADINHVHNTFFTGKSMFMEMKKL